MVRPAGAPTLGRRRDPEIGPKVTAAAIRVYGRDGWSAFTFESVAREAQVGKPALYRRWTSREQLLVDAWEETNYPSARDLGSVRADLSDYADQWIEWYGEPSRGLASVRLPADFQVNETLKVLHRQLIVAPRMLALDALVGRAVERGEVSDSVASDRIVGLFIGGLQWHWIYGYESRLQNPHGSLRDIGEEIIDIILAGVEVVGHRAEATPSGALAAGPVRADRR